MTNYALDYARKRELVGKTWEGNDPSQDFLIAYIKGDPTKSEKARADWIAGLKPGDVIWAEMGAGAGNFLLGCVRQGAKVWRLPTNRIKSAMTAAGDERSLDQVTGEYLERFARQQPEIFYELTEQQTPIAEIAALASGYRNLQDDVRKPLVQKAEAVVSEISLASGANDPTARKAVTEIVLGELFSPKFLATVKQPDLAGTLEAALKKIEIAFYKELDRKLKALPLFRAVFDPIKGCGPRIAGSIIGTIGDIRRFPTAANLKAYAGLHHFENGSRARRKAGELYPVRQELKQACWDFFQQTWKWGKADSPWKAHFLKRVEYEQEKYQLMLILVACEKPETGTADDLMTKACRILNATDSYEKEKDGVAGFLNQLRGQNLADLRTLADCCDQAEIVKLEPETAQLADAKLKIRACERAGRHLQQKLIEHIHREWWKYENCLTSGQPYVYQKPSWVQS